MPIDEYIENLFESQKELLVSYSATLDKRAEHKRKLFECLKDSHLTEEEIEEVIFDHNLHNFFPGVYSPEYLED